MNSDLFLKANHPTTFEREAKDKNARVFAFLGNNTFTACHYDFKEEVNFFCYGPKKRAEEFSAKIARVRKYTH